MLVFVKLGGSLITDKQVEASFKEDVVARLAREIKAALTVDSSLQLLVGHGSGSFGHFTAKRYRTIEGVRTIEEWGGFAEVAVVAAKLNHLVAETFQAAGLRVWRIQPSASARSRQGVLVDMALAPIHHALEHQLIPLIYGDVALDEVLGGTILSTETLFFYLAQKLPVNQILLLGEVDGVYDMEGHVFPKITSSNLKLVEPFLGGSAGVDVTGGMKAKVHDMLSLVSAIPSLGIRIMKGTQEGLLQAVLLGEEQPGTLITAR